MRDHKKLRAFELADQLALTTYRATAKFPKEEMFGLTSQLRRAAVSAPSNIVEGCSRSSQADYLRFQEIAFGSTCEAEYQITLAERLEFPSGVDYREWIDQASETARVLSGLIRSLRNT